MIGIGISEGFFIYLAIWLVLLLILWGRAQLRRHRNQLEISGNQLFNCDNCHYAFLSKDPVNLTRCPRCNAICIKRKKKNSALRR